jgi:hypothetical protein
LKVLATDWQVPNSSIGGVFRAKMAWEVRWCWSLQVRCHAALDVVRWLRDHVAA